MNAQEIRIAASSLRLHLAMLKLFRYRVTSTAGVAEELRDRLAHREENFLTSVERLVFANPRSPYRALLEVAGYDWPMLRQLVLTRGLDAALDQLRVDSVYVRVGEFKGLEPAVRRGRTFRFQERDFANPHISGVLRAQSGGTRTRRTQSDISAEEFLEWVKFRLWLLEGYGLRERDVVIWANLPEGLRYLLQETSTGRRAICFTLLRPPGLGYVLLVLAARVLSGRPVPFLRSARAAQAVELARYISKTNTPRGTLVSTFDSSAVRLVIAAEEAGIDMGDVVFWIGGEPLTPLKHQQFARHGHRVVSMFAFSEFGVAAWSCPRGEEADDLHVLTDRVALRQYTRPVGQNGTTVSSYLFTSLLPYTRHVMINVESGDYGKLGKRRCGCFLDEAGFSLHMHTILSFEKLTAEGMTFIGPGLITLLEEDLPREFGGDSRHYQLVEGEDGRGLTRLFLLVSPQVGPVDEDALRERVLGAIADRHLLSRRGRTIGRIWRGADTIYLLRREPLATESGKVLHLHTARGALLADAAIPPDSQQQR
ncbi:MAG: hypothetical protein XU14_C0081G0006 [Armatimonadetes bacterium CSP1-3]|nr:MAG: hypothetical protein XU14_C0081G0006 [Armatimonadetes bacterium CSP1-3]